MIDATIYLQAKQQANEFFMPVQVDTYSNNTGITYMKAIHLKTGVIVEGLHRHEVLDALKFALTCHYYNLLMASDKPKTYYGGFGVPVEGSERAV